MATNTAAPVTPPAPRCKNASQPLEGASHALAFASGLAAEDTLLRAITKPGDHLLLSNDPYGGTFRLVDSVYRPWGLAYSTAELSDLDAVARAITERTTAVYCETPSNPMLGVFDIAALASLAHEHGALLVVDNTFASPYLQQPLALGADVVVHSTTKYIAGHSDVVGGALVTPSAQLAERLAFHQNAIGAVPGPFDCWLTLRGMKTLAVRMERHCDNAERVVAALRNHPAVSDVRYPGLLSHPDHDIAAKQMRRFGGMVSFQLSGGEEAALRVCERTRLFTLGESLGGVESLIEHPARMTHASTAGSTIAVPADLVRISVGIEDVDDLVADLLHALDS